MNRTIVTIVAIMIPALALIGAAQAPAGSYPPEQQLFKLVNMVRQNAGLEKLEWDPKVAKAAQAHTQQLAGYGHLSHQFPGEPGLEQRVSSTGARFNSAAENVALADSVEEAHLALMNSPGHRANIMDPNYNAVGIGVVQVKNRLYVTQDFAHVVPTYSNRQFREAIVAEFNRARHAHHIGPIDSRPDPRLDQAACSGRLDPDGVLQGLSGATRATIFTASQPSDMPPTMNTSAADGTLRHINIGVCFRQDTGRGSSKFWVVVAFYQ